jgi:hypothetical protein
LQHHPGLGAAVGAGLVGTFFGVLVSGIGAVGTVLLPVRLFDGLCHEILLELRRVSFSAGAGELLSHRLVTFLRPQRPEDAHRD